MPSHEHIVKKKKKNSLQYFSVIYRGGYSVWHLGHHFDFENHEIIWLLLAHLIDSLSVSCPVLCHCLSVSAPS